MSFRDGNNVIVIIIEHIKEGMKRASENKGKPLSMVFVFARFYVATKRKRKFCWFRSFIQATWSGGDFTFLLAHRMPLTPHTDTPPVTSDLDSINNDVNFCGWLFGIHYGLFPLYYLSDKSPFCVKLYGI